MLAGWMKEGRRRRRKKEVECDFHICGISFSSTHSNMRENRKVDGKSLTHTEPKKSK
jgi:hypothetical protein